MTPHIVLLVKNCRVKVKSAMLFFASFIVWTGMYCQTNEVIELSNQGATLHGLAQYQEALKQYNKAIELDPNYGSAYYNRGLTLSDLENYKDAIRDFTKAIKLNPHDHEAYYNRALCHRNLKGFQIAINDLTKALSMSEEYDYYADRGSTYYLINEYHKAVEDYTSAIALNPAAEYYTFRAFCKEELKDLKGAIKDYSQAIVLDPTDFRNYSDRGYAYYELGLYSDACNDWSTAVELGDPRKEDLESDIDQICTYTIPEPVDIENIDVLIDQFCADLMEFEDVGKYSHVPIANDVLVNFISVFRYELEELTDSTFTIAVDPGKGEFCNHVTYKYVKIDKNYFLVFDDIEMSYSLGVESKMVNPWLNIKNNCKQD